MDTLPPLQEAFAYVQNEESRRSVMLPPASTVSTDRSALVSAPQLEGTKLLGPFDHSTLWCDHCNQPHHTRETC